MGEEVLASEPSGNPLRPHVIRLLLLSMPVCSARQMMTLVPASLAGACHCPCPGTRVRKKWNPTGRPRLSMGQSPVPDGAAVGVCFPPEKAYPC
uniref:Predicted protein n=1 Tax=Hordeum vulgare subsp. vulgare TaxID=112509 RepID=F2CUC2_HORVV|nr:predicted protein [Hordeum vulgare subsp. vulgare]